MDPAGYRCPKLGLWIFISVDGIFRQGTDPDSNAARLSSLPRYPGIQRR